MKAIRAGDEKAAGLLLASYRAYLLHLADAVVGPRLRAKVDASDIAQETLLRAHRGLASFRGGTGAEVTAWLQRILAHTLADVMRSYAAGNRDTNLERSLEAALDDSAPVLRALLAANQTTPSGGAARREEHALLEHALARLEPPHREVIRLRNLEGLDWDEIARRMERSKDAARMLWARALTQLRPLLEGPA